MIDKMKMESFQAGDFKKQFEYTSFQPNFFDL